MGKMVPGQLVELVDTQDLKSCQQQCWCRFDAYTAHIIILMGKGYDFETSLPAYKEAKETNIDFCRQQVFIAIRKLGICTDKQIAEKLNWPINRVTPRRNELVKSALVELKYKHPDKDSGRTVCHWHEKPVTPVKQKDLFA